MDQEAPQRPVFPKSYITIDSIVVPPSYWSAPWWRKMLWRMMCVPLPLDEAVHQTEKIVVEVKAKPDSTASITPGLFCRACGWPVIHACCNDEMSREPWGSDWWGYCSNKGCTNHAGEAWGMDGDPEFTFRTQP